MIFYLGVIKLQNIMKIKLDNLDTENFMSHEHILNGEVVTLIQPKNIGAKWKKDNLHFRSSVWNYNGELISASFPKFFNWGEQPDLSPVPTSLKNATVVEKLDGSTLIVSKYKGQYILRTRGTVDASTMANGFELELFKDTILSKLQDNNDTWGYSIIWEWLSPINKIVLSYGDEPMWKLIGFINHINYSLAQQDMLDAMAKKYDLLKTIQQATDQLGVQGDILGSKNVVGATVLRDQLGLSAEEAINLAANSSIAGQNVQVIADQAYNAVDAFNLQNKTALNARNPYFKTNEIVVAVGK